jgi:hypothetical protein
MTQMNDLNPFGLKNAAHDINRCIMAIKQTGRCDHADGMLRDIGHMEGY